MCQKNYLEQERIEEDKMASQHRVGVDDGNEPHIKKKSQQPTPLEDNMLLATWLDTQSPP